MATTTNATIITSVATTSSEIIAPASTIAASTIAQVVATTSEIIAPVSTVAASTISQVAATTTANIASAATTTASIIGPAANTTVSIIAPAVKATAGTITLAATTTVSELYLIKKIFYLVLILFFLLGILCCIVCMVGFLKNICQVNKHLQTSRSKQMLDDQTKAGPSNACLPTRPPPPAPLNQNDLSSMRSPKPLRPSWSPNQNSISIDRRESGAHLAVKCIEELKKLDEENESSQANQSPEKVVQDDRQQIVLFLDEIKEDKNSSTFANSSNMLFLPVSASTIQPNQSNLSY